MIKYVPGKGWVQDGAGMVSGGPVVLESPEEKARQDAYFDAQREWRSDIGDFSQYANGTLQDLAALVKGDSWWDGRLHHMANEVGQGDDSWFIREFLGRGNRDQAKEMVNRFLGLKDQGYSDQDIMRGIYGQNWGVLNPNWMDTDNPDNLAGAPSFDDRYGPATSQGPVKQPSNKPANKPNTNPGGSPPNAGIVPAERKKRLGTWGSGYTDGGYSLFSEENQAMRKVIGDQLEKKLLG